MSLGSFLLSSQFSVADQEQDCARGSTSQPNRASKQRDRDRAEHHESGNAQSYYDQTDRKDHPGAWEVIY